ncbi:hypothetical protein MPLA_750097 [Mesorhizobium sp. ORS 3359]|nr:hypothetical protein MPLA_750097 [Mesorhizobium sp. ORS 3359]
MGTIALVFGHSDGVTSLKVYCTRPDGQWRHCARGPA